MTILSMSLEKSFCTVSGSYFAGTGSSLPRSSSVVTPKISPRLRRMPTSGILISFSHLETACELTFTLFAMSSCVKPLAFLNLENLCPKVSVIIPSCAASVCCICLKSSLRGRKRERTIGWFYNIIGCKTAQPAVESGCHLFFGYSLIFFY